PLFASVLAYPQGIGAQRTAALERNARLVGGVRRSDRGEPAVPRASRRQRDLAVDTAVAIGEDRVVTDPERVAVADGQISRSRLAAVDVRQRSYRDRGVGVRVRNARRPVDIAIPAPGRSGVEPFGALRLHAGR